MAKVSRVSASQVDEEEAVGQEEVVQDKTEMEGLVELLSAGLENTNGQVKDLEQKLVSLLPALKEFEVRLRLLEAEKKPEVQEVNYLGLTRADIFKCVLQAAVQGFIVQSATTLNGDRPGAEGNRKAVLSSCIKLAATAADHASLILPKIG